MRKPTLLLIITILFLHTVKAQYTKLYDFDSIEGNHPSDDLISVGTYLYGMTVTGGISDSGTVFKVKPDGTGYVKLLDFAGPLNGKWPEGSLFSDGTFLFGMTYTGGISNSGIAFKIKPDGTEYTKLIEFNGINGSSPQGSFISDGTFLYGMTQRGGTGACMDGCGVIFKIKPDGTGYSKLLDFASGTDGRNPVGSLFYDGTYLYGMTGGGGANSKGTIFKIKPDGTEYVKLLDFEGNTNGGYPFGNNIISDGNFLYGMTYRGGTSDLGTIFKIKPDGTSYIKLLDFVGTSNGSFPQGSLIFDGTFLYGMAANGGVNNMGAVFKIKPDGTAYTKLLDFVGTSNGNFPQGSLISDGISLYGTTSFGGVNDKGTIFKYSLIPSDIVDERLNSYFVIYPNPSTGVFMIESNKFDAQEIKIYNHFGEKTHEYSNLNKQSKIPIDLSALEKGVYFVNVLCDGETYNRRVIIQ